MPLKPQQAREESRVKTASQACGLSSYQAGAATPRVDGTEQDPGRGSSCVLDLSRERCWGRSHESAVLGRSQDWRWCLYPLARTRQKGGSGDREETNGPRCKPWSPMRRAQQKPEPSEREHQAMWCCRSHKKGQTQAGEEGSSHVWGLQGTQWGAKEEVCWGVSH